MTATLPTIADARQAVGLGRTAIAHAADILERAENIADRDLMTGYAGATALKHLREALREVEKATTQLESVQ